ncbi:MAG TPA: hypothetical protein EYP19_12530 [Desulfobacterales bacterium]|nr:hypothetical protein [Desulfobacterales bacterium]
MPDYLQWLEDAYFLFMARIFDASIARGSCKPKKTYCVYHATAIAVVRDILFNTGILLENLVFAALQCLSPDIYHCKTRSFLETAY